MKRRPQGTLRWIRPIHNTWTKQVHAGRVATTILPDLRHVDVTFGRDQGGFWYELAGAITRPRTYTQPQNDWHACTRLAREQIRHVLECERVATQGKRRG